jgi:hypothetical protein
MDKQITQRQATMKSVQAAIKKSFASYPKSIQRLGLNVSHYGDQVCFWSTSEWVYRALKDLGFCVFQNRDGWTISPIEAATLGITESGLWNIQTDARKKPVKVKD